MVPLKSSGGIQTNVHVRYDSAEALFTSALNNFKDSLPTDDRNTLLDFKSAEEMVRAVEDQVNWAPEKHRLLSCCKKVEQFARKWEYSHFMRKPQSP